MYNGNENMEHPIKTLLLTAIIIFLLSFIALEVGGLGVSIIFAMSLSTGYIVSEVIGVGNMLVWINDQGKEKGGNKSILKSTSLNPLFSEEEISAKNETADKWQKYVLQYFDELFKREKEEVEAHQKSGKDKSTFEPSNELLRIIQKQSMSLLGRNQAMKDYQKMIESNIAIINGATIEETEKSYWNQVCEIPYDNLSIIYHPNIYLDIKKGNKFQEMYDSNLKHREKFWKDSWDYILKKDYIHKENKENY